MIDMTFSAAASELKASLTSPTLRTAAANLKKEIDPT